MGTHPIFESDFDCLTDCRMELTWLYTALALLVATLIFLLRAKKPDEQQQEQQQQQRRQQRRLRQRKRENSKKKSKNDSNACKWSVIARRIVNVVKNVTNIDENVTKKRSVPKKSKKQRKNGLRRSD